jgi:hypothetical protein
MLESKMQICAFLMPSANWLRFALCLAYETCPGVYVCSLFALRGGARLKPGWEKRVMKVRLALTALPTVGLQIIHTKTFCTV